MFAGIALLAAAQAPVSPSLRLQDGSLLVSDGAKTYSIPISEAAAPPAVVRYRKGDRYVVWDDRGLTTRDKDWTFAGRFEQIPVSPKIFSREQILQNLQQFGTKEKTQAASALSGATRIGGLAYLLPRWQDSVGKPWLEALVVLDLEQPNPKPALLGRFHGFSLAAGSVDERLFAIQEKPAAITRGDPEWGLATYDPKSGQFQFKKLGERLRAHAFLGPTRLAYVEALDYGPSRLGLVDLISGRRQDLYETRGAIRLVDAKEPLVSFVAGETHALVRNVHTGATWKLERDAGTRRIDPGLVVWWPRAKPEKAVLLDYSRMVELASWSATPPAASSPARSQGANSSSRAAR